MWGSGMDDDSTERVLEILNDIKARMEELTTKFNNDSYLYDES